MHNKTTVCKIIQFTYVMRKRQYLHCENFTNTTTLRVRVQYSIYPYILYSSCVAAVSFSKNFINDS